MTNVSVALKSKTRDEDFKTGLDDAYRSEMAADLSAILAATYKLTIKSHLYHWNVVGPLFRSIHELTEEHYQALFEATDILAERIRALGHVAPVDPAKAVTFAPAASDIAETTAESMINDLISDHEDCVRALRNAADLAETAGDFVTTDILTDRCAFHEKALWMLKAIVTA